MISGCRRWKWLPVVAGGVLSSGGAGSGGASGCIESESLKER